ncbi:hypothetical protein [Allosphingosinicella sp.]|jgi:hypothetical protein|uniref:hypothetical protein n=1 Tax=Allosphingosinicella sp. TaxID=2823234 RepID=UPI002F19667C
MRGFAALALLAAASCSLAGGNSNATSNTASGANSSSSQSDPVSAEALTSDLRCFLAFTMLAENGPAERRQQSLTAAIYFLGRLDGRDSRFDLERRAEAEGPSLQRDGEALVRRCAQILERRGQEVTAIGQRISERERAKARPRP